MEDVVEEEEEEEEPKHLQLWGEGWLPCSVVEKTPRVVGSVLSEAISVEDVHYYTQWWQHYDTVVVSTTYLWETYGSADYVNQDRKKGIPSTEEELRLFSLGLEVRQGILAEHLAQSCGFSFCHAACLLRTEILHPLNSIHKVKHRTGVWLCSNLCLWRSFRLWARALALILLLLWQRCRMRGAHALGLSCGCAY
ncbi:hypothetical protein L7F22_049347 [Adiantum nelumboides]|nr:hypothetical protein [Adiantum nelumboides]